MQPPNVAPDMAVVHPTFRKASVAPVSQSKFAASAAQPRITVTYQDADIRDVIAAFAVFSGRTIVVGKGVAGNVSAEVRDQPWDVALRAILQAQGLAAKEDQDGIIAVDSYENIAKQQASEPLTTQIISVNYARASTLVSTVKSLLSKECAPGTAARAGEQHATARFAAMSPRIRPPTACSSPTSRRACRKSRTT